MSAVYHIHEFYTCGHHRPQVVSMNDRRRLKAVAGQYFHDKECSVCAANTTALIYRAECLKKARESTSD